MSAQRVGLGISGSWLFTGGHNIQAACLGDEHRGGIGPTLSYAEGRRFTVTVNARAWRMRDFGSCQAQADVLPPPADGTVVFQDRYTLLADKFVTTDARAEYRARRWLGVGAGAGVAWHEGPDFPYGVLAAQLFPVARPRLSLGFGLELYGMNVATDRTEVTFANSQIVSSEPLPRERSWSHALALTATLRLLP
jgi:hypothetical protein